MEQQEINYIDCVNLGFKKETANDSVWLKQYGYEYFILSMKLTKDILLDWDLRTRFVRMIRCDKQGTILGKIQLSDLAEVQSIVKFFTNKDKYDSSNFYNIA